MSEPTSHSPEHVSSAGIPTLVEYDLTRLRPSEIMALDLLTTGDSSRLAGSLDISFAALAQQNLEYARVVYTACAESSSEFDRQGAASRIPSLCRVDHDFALALWQQLACDPDQSVRNIAISIPENFKYLIEHGDYDDAQYDLDFMGLTKTEVLHLLDLAEAAGRGEGVFHLGEVALAKLISTDTPQSK